jgi:hypothetical protein
MAASLWDRMDRIEEAIKDQDDVIQQLFDYMKSQSGNRKSQTSLSPLSPPTLRPPPPSPIPRTQSAKKRKTQKKKSDPRSHRLLKGIELLHEGLKESHDIIGSLEILGEMDII